MHLFKAILKIVKKNWLYLVLYFGIFLLFALLFTQTTNNTTYEKVKVNTYVDIEEESEYARKFLSYLDDYINIVDIKNQTVDDAIFYRDIKMALYIKKGFEANFFSSEKDIIGVKTVPESMDASQLRDVITSYISDLRSLVKLGLATEENAFEVYNETIKKANTKTDCIIPNKESNNLAIYSYYNYSGYIISALVLMIVSIIMLSFKPLEIKRRMNICAISNRRINLTLILSNLILTVIFCGLLFILALILYGKMALNDKMIYYVINSLALALVMVTLAYFLSCLIDSSIIIQALGTVIPLAGAFLGGIFVPLEFMNKGVLFISKMTPQYWFIKANEYIYNNTINFSEFISNLSIMLIFVAVFGVGIVIATKLKSKQETQKIK